MITNEMISKGIAVLASHTYGNDLDDVVSDVYTEMRKLEPLPVDPSNIIYAPNQNDGTLSQWHNSSITGVGSSIGVASGIPSSPSPYVVKATIGGSGSDYARVQFHHDSVPTPRWGEGTDVWYSAFFYLPLGFYAAKNSSNDLMRWDAYVNGSQDMQGGLGMRQDDTLRIMSNYPYTEPLPTSYKIPEAKWTKLEVHQKLSEFNGKALNELYVDGVLKASSTVPNYKGSAYPATERAINRLRVGIVSEGTVSDSNSLYFDKFVISKVRIP